MRAIFFLLFAVIVGLPAGPAHADAPGDAFKARIEAALSPAAEGTRLARLGKLFYRGGIDDWAAKLAGRTAKRLAALRGHRITFASLPPGTETLHVINGYEYRPNLKPLGYVVFTDPAAAPGNNTKIFYGQLPGGQGYAFPLTVRRLVNPAAPPDKQLQILTIGMAHPPATFTGWCDIALSNNTVKRITLEDQKVGNQTLIMRGQAIKRCEVRNTTGRGALSLRLYEDDRKIFERHIEFPKTVITYSKQ